MSIGHNPAPDKKNQEKHYLCIAKTLFQIIITHMNIKNLFYSAAIATATVWGLVSCNDHDEPIEEITVDNMPRYIDGAQVYSVSIKAHFDDLITTQSEIDAFFLKDGVKLGFDTTDVCYLYNETKRILACKSDGTAISLKATDISADGMSCTFKADMTFFDIDYSTGSVVVLDESTKHIPVIIDSTDTWGIFYKLSETDWGYPMFTFIQKDGSINESLKFLFAKAQGLTLNMTPDGNLSHDTSVRLERFWSILRFKTDITDKNGDTIKDIHYNYYEIQSHNENSVSRYVPDDDEFIGTSIDVGDIDQNGYTYIASYFTYDDDRKSDNDYLEIIALDKNYYYYSGATGICDPFEIGKLYTFDVTLNRMSLEVRRSNYNNPLIQPTHGKYMLDSLGTYMIERSDDTDIYGVGNILIFGHTTAIYGSVNLTSLTQKDKDGNTEKRPCYIRASARLIISNPGKDALVNNDPDGGYINLLGWGIFNIEGNVRSSLYISSTRVIIKGNLTGTINLAKTSYDYPELTVYGDWSKATILTDSEGYKLCQKQTEDGGTYFYLEEE